MNGDELDHGKIAKILRELAELYLVGGYITEAQECQHYARWHETESNGENDV